MKYFKDKYDCIIIGGAIASLAAAIELRKANLDVLVLEQHNLPGGVATSFVRKGYEFEASLHEMMSIGDEKSPLKMRQYFDENGIDIKWLRVPDAYRLISEADNIDITIPFGIEKAINVIADYVPGSRESLVYFFDWCKKINDSNTEFKKGNIKTREIIKKHFELVGTGNYSVKEMLEFCKVPERAQKILSAYWYYLGSPIEMTPFIPFAVVLMEYIGGGAYVPRSTSYEMSLKMAEKAISLGAQLEYNQRVDKVIADSKKHVSGVILASGETINADYIICNAYPQNLYLNMITPSEFVPKKAKQVAQSRRLNVSCLSVLMILDNAPSYFNLDRYSTFISKNEMNSSEQFKSLFTKDPYDYVTLICMNFVEGYRLDKNKTYISITSLPFGSTYEDVSKEEYFKVKNNTAKTMIKIIEDKFKTDLSGHIELLEVITPVTISHYTGAYKGSIYGNMYRMDDNVIAKQMQKKKDQFYDNLFFCGAHTASGDGMTPVIYSGIQAAKDLISSIKEKK